MYFLTEQKSYVNMQQTPNPEKIADQIGLLTSGRRLN